jgi:hypothetical protein
MTDPQDISTIADQVMDKYKAQLNVAIGEHDAMLEKARAGMAELIAESNQQFTELAAQMQASMGQEPAKPMPEVAWVPSTPGGKPDHLVLNPQAIELIDKLFTAINEVLPELAKLVKRR